MLKRAAEISMAGEDRSTLIVHNIFVLAFLSFSLIYIFFYIYFLSFSKYIFCILLFLLSHYWFHFSPLSSSLDASPHLPLFPSPSLLSPLLLLFAILVLSAVLFWLFLSPLYPFSYSRAPRRGSRANENDFRSNANFAIA